MTEFGALNWTILGAYIVANLLLGVFLSTRIKTADHYYLGTRQTPWWAIGISVVATYVSALSFLGGPAWSYTEGLSVIAIHLNYPIVIFLVITLFLPFFYNSGVASIYDYQERRFGIRSPNRALDPVEKATSGQRVSVGEKNPAARKGKELSTDRRDRRCAGGSLGSYKGKASIRHGLMFHVEQGRRKCSTWNSTWCPSDADRILGNA